MMAVLSYEPVIMSPFGNTATAFYAHLPKHNCVLVLVLLQEAESPAYFCFPFVLHVFASLRSVIFPVFPLATAFVVSIATGILSILQVSPRDSYLLSPLTPLLCGARYS